MLIVCDAGYDLARPAFLLTDLPVEVLGRLRSDRVLRRPAPTREPDTIGRRLRHSGEFHLADPGTWPEPHHCDVAPASQRAWTYLSRADRVWNRDNIKNFHVQACLTNTNSEARHRGTRRLIRRPERRHADAAAWAWRRAKRRFIRTIGASGEQARRGVGARAGGLVRVVRDHGWYDGCFRRA